MNSGFTITNKITGQISIPVTKQWVGPVGESAVVNLIADGTTVDTVTLDKGNKWKHTFENLQKYDSEDGHEIEYKVTENAIDGYDTSISGSAENGFTITNTITGKLSIPVTKNWIGPATESVNISLLADDKVVNTVTLNADNKWQHTFTDLQKYDSTDGHEINYTISEIAVDGYKTEISGDAENGFTVTNTVSIQTSIPVTKQWVGTAADSATINLIADGNIIDTVTLSAENNWYHIFTALPKYDSADGHEIKYAITENEIEGYTTTIVGDAESGFIVTNTKDKAPDPNPEPQPQPNPAKVNFEALKTLDGQTPASDLFSFELKDENGNLIQTKKNKDNKITFDTLIFSEVDTHKYYISEVKGKDDTIIYDSTVYEAIIDVTLSDNYNAKVTYKKDGQPIDDIPTFKNETKVLPSITVIKEWNDNNNATDRPYFVKVQLYKDGVPFGDPIILNEENNWQYTWENLDENAKWTVDELDVPSNYKKTVKNDGNTFTITNKLKRHIPLVPDINAPHTGNDIFIALLTFILIISICTSATIIYNKNRKYKKHQRK